MGGPAAERRILNALAGPNDEAVTCERRGSCCVFERERSRTRDPCHGGRDRPVSLLLLLPDEGLHLRLDFRKDALHDLLAHLHRLPHHLGHLRDHLLPEG